MILGGPCRDGTQMLAHNCKQSRKVDRKNKKIYCPAQPGVCSEEYRRTSFHNQGTTKMKRTTFLIVLAAFVLAITSQAQAFYNPRLASFNQRDPLGYIDSMNLHEYMGSNPEGRLDPYGTDFIALTDRWLWLTGAAFHYAVEYWEYCDKVELRKGV